VNDSIPENENDAFRMADANLVETEASPCIPIILQEMQE